MRAFFQQLYHWLLHRLVFAGKTGTIDFYGLDETEVPADGYIVVRATLRENEETVLKELTYGYVFENRYLMYLSPHARAVALWSRLNIQCPDYRPLLMVEGNHAYTPYCAYATVPPLLARRLNLPAFDSSRVATV